jgi:hypothetical protein
MVWYYNFSNLIRHPSFVYMTNSLSGYIRGIHTYTYTIIVITRKPCPLYDLRQCSFGSFHTHKEEKSAICTHICAYVCTTTICVVDSVMCGVTTHTHTAPKAKPQGTPTPQPTTQGSVSCATDTSLLLVVEDKVSYHTLP